MITIDDNSPLAPVANLLAANTARIAALETEDTLLIAKVQELTNQLAAATLTPRQQLIHDLIVAGKSWAATKIPYVFNSEGYTGMDCSAYVQTLYGFFGITLPRASYQQFLIGAAVGWNDVQPGDLLFFKFDKTNPHPTTHVAICIGNGQMLHTNAAPQTFHVSNAAPDFYAFVGAKRVIA